MPKISEEQRSARRRQILDAARACFYRRGLHVTTMADIIQASGLSAGAVYLYFRSKEEIIEGAVTGALADLARTIAPLFDERMPPDPEGLVREFTGAIERFTERGEFNLRSLAIHGWSEAQLNEKLRNVMRGIYGNFRTQLAEVARNWQKAGVIDPQSNPEDVAKTLLSLLLGFVVQSVLLGDALPDAQARGLKALVRPREIAGRVEKRAEKPTESRLPSKRLRSGKRDR